MKRLTKENWLETESVLTSFVKLSLRDGSVAEIPPDEWAERFLTPQLAPDVPTNIQELFEVARGSIAYGCFFYPLFTLAAEQLLRVAEAAVTAKCQQLKAPKRVKSYMCKLDYLAMQGLLTDQEKDTWDFFRYWRNKASHPHQQTILMPKDALWLLTQVAKRINELFE